MLLKLMKPFPLLSVVIGILACVGPAAQGAIVSTLTTAVGGASGFDDDTLQAQRFSLTGGPWDVTSMVAVLSAPGADAAATPKISIYTDNAAATTPGTSLFAFSSFTPELSSAAAYNAYTFTGTGDPALSAGTYWIVFSSNNTFAPSIAGNDSTVTNTGTNGTADFVRRNSLNGGPWTGTNRTFLWEINATAVPEPSSMMLAAVVGMGLLKRRR